MSTMSLDELIGTTQRLNVSVEVLAALAAHMRIQTEGLEPDPQVAAAIGTVLTNAGIDVDTVDAFPPPALRAVAGAIGTFMLQAQDLIAAPDRPCDWTHAAPAVMEAQGRASTFVARLFETVAPSLGDLDARLRGPDARLLDVGTGVGMLAIAFCNTFPQARVTGIDAWPTALQRAERNVAEAGMAERIELREQSVTDVPDEGAFDAAWVPATFLSEQLMDAALRRIRPALRPGGWALIGQYAGPPEPLPQSLAVLRTVRSGGRLWSDDEAVALLEGAGYEDVRAIERTWLVPIGLVAGRAPA